MTVRAVGIDLADVSRMARALERTPALADRLFTAAERSGLAGAPTGGGGTGVAGLREAQLFSVKEAVMKALGLGLDSLSFTDIEVVAGDDGGVTVDLRGGAAEAAAGLGIRRWSIETAYVDGPLGPVAVAEVVAEAEPAPPGPSPAPPEPA